MNYNQLILNAKNLPVQINSLNLNLQLYKEIKYTLKIT